MMDKVVTLVQITKIQESHAPVLLASLSCLGSLVCMSKYFFKNNVSSVDVCSMI